MITQYIKKAIYISMFRIYDRDNFLANVASVVETSHLVDRFDPLVVKETLLVDHENDVD